jgi:hypothetical protein
MKEAIVEITEVCNSLTRNSGEINVAHHDHEVKG